MWAKMRQWAGGNLSFVGPTVLGPGNAPAITRLAAPTRVFSSAVVLVVWLVLGGDELEDDLAAGVALLNVG